MLHASQKLLFEGNENKAASAGCHYSILPSVSVMSWTRLACVAKESITSHNILFLFFIGKKWTNRVALWEAQFGAKKYIWYTNTDRTTIPSLQLELFAHFLYCQLASSFGVPSRFLSWSPGWTNNDIYSYLVSWCFEPSQPPGIISLLNDIYILALYHMSHDLLQGVYSSQQLC